MSSASPGRRERVLDPIERSSEVLFGLIMVLSFTGTISVASAGREEVRELLIGALGCNLAWGIIDAVMYLLMLVIERGRSLTIGRAVRGAKDAAQGRQHLLEALPDELVGLIDGEALERARTKLVALPDLPGRPRLRLRDLRGALGVFLLVFLSTLPVVLPFVFITELQPALRVSNAVALAMLYIAGHVLARHAGLSTVRTGLAMAAIGVVLVGVTIALGG
jgi:VIT1/CCC1 family predicted Fe2+/Mn2+ transporter